MGLLYLPILMTVLGGLLLIAPPKNINWLYGYRTRRSTSSKEAWEYSQKTCGNMWLSLGLGLTAIICFANILGIDSSHPVVIFSLLGGFISLLSPIPYIESKLKENFNL